MSTYLSRPRIAQSPGPTSRPHDLPHGRRGWAMLALSIATYAAASIVMHQPFHLGGLKLRDFDLRIYHLAALRLRHGGSLYGSPMLDGLGFTYPPFAALVLAPLAWLPWSVDVLGVAGLNVVLLVFGLRRALLLADSRTHGSGPAVELSRAGAWSLAAGMAALALWLEPITVTLGYGQIDLLIMALVVFDLSRPDTARTKGVAIGIAAAIKLTPLLFIAYLLFSRRGRAAVVAGLSFAAAIGVSFLAAAGDASRYWLHTVSQTSRIGDPITPINQSLRGLIARFTGAAHLGGGAEVLIAVVAVAGLALAVRASRDGDEALGFSLAALSALLASPISWVHHWTLAVPALVLLARRAHTTRSRPLAVAAVALGIVGCAWLPELAYDDFGATRGAASLLLTDPYPLAAVLVLAVCAVAPVRMRARRSSGWPETAARPARRPRSGAVPALRPGLGR